MNLGKGRNAGYGKEMKKMIIATMLLGVALGMMSTAQAATKVFKNCTALNKIYPGGVALPGAINSGGATKQKPRYDKALYIANKKSDRDKDGIACEK
jgi:hypothetical protein